MSDNLSPFDDVNSIEGLPVVDRIPDIVRTAIAVGALLVGAALGWARMEAALDRKADRSELMQVRAEVLELRTIMVEIKLQNAQIIRFLCQPRPHDLGCQR
jgi:hypothetical protein